MKKSEFFAASQFLTDWPDGMSFDELTDAVFTGSDLIVPWCMVENWSNADLCDAITDMEKAFSRAVADILNEEKEPEPSKALNSYFGDVDAFLRDHLTVIHVKNKL